MQNKIGTSFMNLVDEKFDKNSNSLIVTNFQENLKLLGLECKVVNAI